MRDSKEYKEILRLKRQKKVKLEQMGLAQHVGYKVHKYIFE